MKGLKMRNLISKIYKEKTDIFKILVLLMLFFGSNVYLSYATDTYCTFRNGFYVSAQDMATRNGRPIIGLIYGLHYLSGLSNISFYYISTFWAFIFLGAAVWLYQKLLAKQGMSSNIRVIVSFIAISNIFIIEYFTFIEKCGFMLAILFNIIAVYFIESYFEKKRIKYIIATLITLVLGIFTYQGSIALFVILSIPFAFKYSNDLKKYVSNIFYICIAYAIPIIVDMSAFKIFFKSTRISEKIDIISNIKTVLHGVITYGVSTFGILPRFLFLILVFLVFILSIITVLGRKNKVLYIINIIWIVLASIIFSTATIVQGSGWWATRTTYPIVSVMGALEINLFMNHMVLECKNIKIKIIKGFAVSAIAALLVGQFFSFNKIYIDKYKVNALDEYRYDFIGQTISDYQNSTGVEVTKVAFYNDAARTYPAYPGLYSEGDLVVSAFYPEWSDLTALNYYLSSNYEKIEPSDKYIEYFSKQNWNKLSRNQLIFEGDTLHICVY